MINPTGRGADIQAVNAIARARLLTFDAGEKLATGLRINRGSDGPADVIAIASLDKQLAILEAETRSLERADAVIATADAAAAELSTLVRDASGAAVAAANTGAMSDAERAAYQLEMDSLAQSADRVSQRASFNGQRLFSGDVTARTGASPADASFTIDRITASTLGETAFADGSFGFASIATGGAVEGTGARNADAFAVIDNAAGQAATLRGGLGAFQRNAIGSTLASKREAIVQTSAALSTIRDADFAVETSRLTRGEALTEASIFAALAGRSSRERAFGLIAGG